MNRSCGALPALCQCERRNPSCDLVHVSMSADVELAPQVQGPRVMLRPQRAGTTLPRSLRRRAFICHYDCKFIVKVIVIVVTMIIIIIIVL